MGKRISISDDDIDIFKKATSSQYSSTLYDQLVKDKRIDKFIQALQVCALRNLSLSKTCEYITFLFPSYVRGKGLNPKTLSNMISFYPELEDAWTFNSDLVKVAAFNRAKALMEITDDINVIDKFNKMYDDGSMLYIREQKDGEQDSNCGVNVNLFNSRMVDDISE